MLKQRKAPTARRLAVEWLERRDLMAAGLVASSFFDNAVYELNPTTGAVLQTLVPPTSPVSSGALLGPSGMTVAEISVRGVLQSRSGLIAMVQGPDNRTYIVHPGDKLLDGAIKSITPQGLVIEQAVNDPLSVVKQREVRKLLRGLKDAK